MRTHSIQILLTILATALIASLALGETLTLKDGTVLEGTVIKKGDVYWVKTRDGKTQEIPVADVAQVGSQSPGGTAPLGGDVFNATRRRAEACTNPTEAIAHWQKFIDANLDNSDLAAAESEMKKWQDLAEGGAEKIGGKWVGGEERKKILAKAQQLTREGFDLMQKDQTLQALKKLQEAAKVYPNSFQVNFLLGYLSMLQRKDDEAIKYFEQALRQRPNSPEALANIAIAYSSKKQHEKAINTLRRAAEAEDSQPIVQNLINAIYAAPPAMQRNAKIKPAIEAAQLLAAKYGISGPSQQFYLVPLKPESVKDENSGEAIGAMMSSGTGFFITDDGLILTNRHVVEGGKTFLVMLTDGTQQSAEVVIMDDDQDLALVRIKPKDKLPFVKLSALDAPGDGAECTVMGFPLIDRLGASIKITRGIVSSSTNAPVGPDVVIDAKVNPGNSGGPILDKHGHVMAVVSMKSLASATEDSYGLGISAGRVRQFLEKNKVDVSAGKPGPAALSAEEIATSVKPATVCIVATH